MPLKITRRKDTGALTIDGAVEYPDGTRVRVRRRAQSDDPKLAREEAATIEAQLLRDAWHGERRGVRCFAEAVVSYCAAASRSGPRRMTLQRLVLAIGKLPLSRIDQDTLTRLRGSVIRPASGDRTFAAQIVEPVTAVMNHANRRGWCDPPHFTQARQPEGRTRVLTPAEAARLHEAAAPHLRPLIVFLLCTGARMSEALGLEWRDVDLQGGRATFWGEQTKSGRRRVARLPTRAVVCLAQMPHVADRVFTVPTGEPYSTSRERGYGGQVKTAWASAIRRAGLDEEVTPHVLRHTWASWHYALHRDPLALKAEGGWSSLALVERYAHLLPAAHEAAIREFWGITTAEEMRA